VLSAIALSGCMAIPIAGIALSGVGLYSTLNPEKNVDIQMDDSGKGRLLANLKDVNHLAILASGSLAVAFSDVWEKAGKQSSIMTGQGDPAALSLSQAKTTLAFACRSGVQGSGYARAGTKPLGKLLHSANFISR